MTKREFFQQFVISAVASGRLDANLVAYADRQWNAIEQALKEDGEDDAND